LNRLAVNRGKTAICVEVCYNEGDDIESMGENKVFSKVMEGLRDFYRISDADVLDMWSKKVPFAYSIYKLEYRERLLRLAECLFVIDNFISFGRQGSFRYNHMTNSIMSVPWFRFRLVRVRSCHTHTRELLLLFFIILPIFFTIFVVSFIKIVIFIFTIILP